MDIRKKLFMNLEELIEHGPITIVAFGDSVTHSSFEIDPDHDSIDFKSSYWNRLRDKIINLREYVPVNVINAGIGGTTAHGSLERLQRQVIDVHPDLVIVCFGLNDVNSSLDQYAEALRTIFERCKQADAEVIFMTPNMLNTYVSDEIAAPYREYATLTAEQQNNGTMDRFMDTARKVAAETGVAVCDCYAKWKELSRATDTTKLLANRINHPTREMHDLFAESLFQMIFGEIAEKKQATTESTMYSQK